MFLVKYKIEIPFFLYHTDISMRNHYNQSDNKMAKNSIRRAYQESKKIFKWIFSMETDYVHKRKTESSLTQEVYVGGIYGIYVDNSYQREESKHK